MGFHVNMGFFKSAVHIRVTYIARNPVDKYKLAS